MRIKIEDIEESNFYKMPKSLYEMNLKPIDREVYMMCLENWRASVKNGWLNSEGEIYFYNSQEKLTKILNVSKPTIIDAFKKLIQIGLIEVEKEKGKPSKYFLIKLEEPVKKLDQSKNFTSKETLPHQSKNFTTTSKETLPYKEINTKNNYKEKIIYIYKGLSEKVQEVLNEFYKHRNNSKKKLTEYAQYLFLKKLIEHHKTDEEKINVMNESIEKGWLTIRPFPDEGKNCNENTRGNKMKDKFDLLREV